MPMFSFDFCYCMERKWSVESARASYETANPFESMLCVMGKVTARWPSFDCGTDGGCNTIWWRTNERKRQLCPTMSKTNRVSSIYWKVNDNEWLVNAVDCLRKVANIWYGVNREFFFIFINVVIPFHLWPHPPHSHNQHYDHTRHAYEYTQRVRLVLCLCCSIHTINLHTQIYVICL